MLNRFLREKVNIPFLEYIKDAVVVLSRDGRILEANSHFTRLAGIKKESLLGMECRSVEILSPLWNTIAASLLDRTEHVERVLRKGLIFDASITPIVTENEVNHIAISFRDVTSIVNLEQQFAKRNRELVIANILTSAFISSSDIETVYAELLETVLLVCGVNMGWVVLKHDNGFDVVARHGVSNGFKDKIEGDVFDGIYEKVLRFEGPFYVLDSKSDDMPELMRSEGLAFFAAMPLRVGSDILGLVVLASRTSVDFEFDAASLFSLIGNTMSLITEKIKLFQETQRLALTDSLTGLFNMRHFYSVLDNEVQRTQRYGVPFSLILFDIDNFKILNDTYGHQAGDEMIRSVSEQMLKTVRKTDILARFGGEEFIALLPYTDKDEALHLGERLKEAAEVGKMVDGKHLTITLSGGVATFPDDARDGKELLYAADMSMYESKAAGKNKITCYTKGK
jgi:diguanylate cyclase (GGDEF)-like protein/PAS domain S-box-containing protein